MKRFVSGAWRILKSLPLALVTPLFLALAAVGLGIADVLAMFRRRLAPSDTQPARHAASIVIPNWNGRDLLDKYLPSVIASIEPHPGSEIIVVDNGSEDGSAAFVRERFPSVKVLRPSEEFRIRRRFQRRLPRRQDTMWWCSSTATCALTPISSRHCSTAFTDEKTFAVSCQIFFSDPNKLREETGLTEGWWLQGALRVRHREEPTIRELFPCFYGGGGSCAFDRRKFLELGGFDELLRPFYLEDTDLGYLAWKRGWKVLLSTRERGVSRTPRHHRQTLQQCLHSKRP